MIKSSGNTKILNVHCYVLTISRCTSLEKQTINFIPYSVHLRVLWWKCDIWLGDGRISTEHLTTITLTIDLFNSWKVKTLTKTCGKQFQFRIDSNFIIPDAWSFFISTIVNRIHYDTEPHTQLTYSNDQTISQWIPLCCFFWTQSHEYLIAGSKNKTRPVPMNNVWMNVNTYSTCKDVYFVYDF